MKKLFLALGFVTCLLSSSCSSPELVGTEYVNSISRGDGFYDLEVYRVKLDKQHDYLIALTKSQTFGLCHDPECTYCKSTSQSDTKPSEDWSW